MKLLYIILLSITVVIVGWVVWIIGEPKGYQLTDDVQKSALDAMLGVDTEHGNAVTTFCHGKEFVDSLMDDISKAKNHIHMEFFKFEGDDECRRIGNALAAKTGAGVESRILYDDLVCNRSWRRLYAELENNGVQVAAFGKVHWPLFTQKDYYRNHRKIVVVDGRTAYIGGMNIAQRYIYGLPWGRWRDTMVRIEGPAALAAQRVFAGDWCYGTGQLLTRNDYFPAPVQAGTTPVRIVPSGPLGEGPAILRQTMAILDNSKKYVWFESPYFIPTKDLLQSLKQASQRGVDIRILLPPRGDRGESTQLASKSFFAEVMKSGINIGVYQPGYMHSKIIVADDSVGIVGSCNLDPRSHLLCEEVAAVIEDSSYAMQLKEIFLADEAESKYIDIDEWRQRPIKERIGESLNRVISSQL